MPTAALEPDTEAHLYEHSIEVELPFLRALRADMSFVPICLARLTLAECRELGKNIARAVESGGRTLLVASTDMSHYLAADVARALDERAIERVQNLDPEGLYRVVTDLDISMCGFVPTTVTLFAARALGATRATLFATGTPASAPAISPQSSATLASCCLQNATRARMSPVSGSLAPGFLVAAPPLGDPNFDRSVVLLAAHGPDGAFGWVLNGRAVMTLGDLLVRADLLSEPPDLAGSVRVGGPVSPDQVWLVYRAEPRFEELDGQLDLGQGVIASASRKVLEAIAEGAVPESLMALVGYAGWAPGQLENEIRAGAWLPTDMDVALVFDVPREKLWQAAYERVGTTPMAFTSRTVGSA